MPDVEPDLIVPPQVIAHEIQSASAFVTPFAAAVAAELAEFGLTKPKIDEILLRSARRFGSSGVEAPLFQETVGSEVEEASWVGGWFKAVGDQAYDFFSTVLPRHGRPAAEAVFAAVAAGVEQMLVDWVNGKVRPKPQRRRASAKSAQK